MDRLMVGVSGVRGTVGGSLTPRVACDFGCAFGTMLGAGRKVVLGRDSRTSGPMVRNAVVSGLLATGVDVVDTRTADYFIKNVFNFPTLAEAYKVAAYNGLNKLRHI